MSLRDEQKRMIEHNLKQLDYLNGDGLFGPKNRELADEFFVFISAGGVGMRALVELKEKMKRAVRPEEISKKTMFLAIDSDWDAVSAYVDSGYLLPEETFKLSYEDARRSIHPEKILPQTKAWVHPHLWNIFGSAAGDSQEFNNVSPGSIRQVERVIFAQPVVQEGLYAHLTRIQSKLAMMGGSPKIKVFFLVGLAGAAGSGIIVDLAYLCRHHLKTILATAYSRTDFWAYLFLPSGCGNEIEPKKKSLGNQRAYAALKEIDYYMTISRRGESFHMDYGTVCARNVEMHENIFDFCTLVEGIGAGGIIFSEPAKTARQVVADSILNIICAKTVNNVGYRAAFCVDSYLRSSPWVLSKIERHSDSQWPRESNYIYNVIGCSACVVPEDLLTLYVAKKVFDEVFRGCGKALHVTEESANSFLQACGLGISTLAKNWDGIQKEHLLSDIQCQADAEFIAHGPYYMVNLTNLAARLLEQAQNNYLCKAIERKNSLFSRREKWEIIENTYRNVISYLRQINHSLYNTYTYSFDVLKYLLEDNVRILTDTNAYRHIFGKSYQWSPVDLTEGDQATKAVIEYLDNLMTPQEIRRLARLFLSEACDKKDKWTGLTPDLNTGRITFDVAKEIRDFISVNLQMHIPTIEQILVQAYSGQVNAPATTFDENGAVVCSQEMSMVAETMLQQLLRNATSLADVSGVLLEEMYNNTFLFVPKDCEYLCQALECCASRYGIAVYRSEQTDKIALQRVYRGIPAWAFYWTSRAEEIYELEGAHRVGIHICQGENTINGAELPNLYPEKLWSDKERSIRQREEEISQGVRTLMRKAKEYGLLQQNELEPDYMDLYLLKSNIAKEDLIKKFPAKDAKEMVSALIEIDMLEKVKIARVGMAMTTLEALGEEELAEFRFDLACRVIRVMPSLWKNLKETLKIIENYKY